jgi:hypothetical protein
MNTNLQIKFQIEYVFPEILFNPGLALIGLWKTGPQVALLEFWWSDINKHCTIYHFIQ